MEPINFNAKKDLIQSKAQAMAALSEISNLALQAAADIHTGEHTKTAMELLLEFGEKLKAHEAFLEAEALD